MFDLPVVSLGDTRVTLYALLAFLLCLAGAAGTAACLCRRGWKAGRALLFCLVSGAFGLLAGRALYFAVRSEYFLDPLGQFVGLGPFFDPSLGSVSVTGVIPGLFFGGWLACRAFGENAPETFDAAAVPGLLLFAALSLIEPLSGQGYGGVLTQPLFCRVPLGIQNSWGEWLLSVSFLEGVLLLAAAAAAAGLRLHRPGLRTLCALVLMSCFLIIPESLRDDDALRIFTFARVTQIGYCALIVLSEAILWRISLRDGLGRKQVFLRAAVLLLTVLLLIACEFGLDKLEWPDWTIYLPMGLILLGTAYLFLRRAARR